MFTSNSIVIMFGAAGTRQMHVEHMLLVQLSALSLIMSSFMSPKNVRILSLQLCTVNKYAELKER